MKQKLLLSFFLLTIPFILTQTYASSNPEIKKHLYVIKVSGVINPVSSQFIIKNISKANSSNAEALIIELDTPGGLDTSMRDIVKNIISSNVPIVTYVSPSGARAASAGAFITIASHIAAMAPGTNIGAAHPVSVGEKMDKTMAEKATNDAAAYIRSLAEKNKRNVKWAEDAVRKSISSTETEALREHVIDIVSKDIERLLKDLNGREVVTASGRIKLSTINAEVRREEMNFRDKILNFITDPSVAYMLLLLGFYGLFFELTNPGTVFPGVTGAIFLILAFYAFQTLPVNYAGLLLIILSIVLFVLEIKITSHGLLTIGGIISMVIGSLMLFDSPAPFFRLPIFLILPAVIVTALFFTLTISLAYRALRKKPVTGMEGLIGLTGKAISDITKEDGMVSIRGELWSAYSDENISKGDTIEVVSLTGLKMKVKKKGG